MDVSVPVQVAPQIVLCRHQTEASFGSYIDGEYVFHYVERGTCRFRLEDRVYVLEAGHSVLIPPYLPHAMLRQGRGLAHLFVVHFTYPYETEPKTALPMVVRIVHPDRRGVAQAFFALRDAWAARSAGSALTAAGRTMELLGLHAAYGHQAPVPRTVSSKAWRNVEAAMQLLHSDCARPWTLVAIARHVGLSPNYLCNVFREYTGKTPHEFLNHIRVEKAKILLCAAETNCSEVAERVGFSSIHLFSRVFRRHTGRPPTAWLQEMGLQ